MGVDDNLSDGMRIKRADGALSTNVDGMVCYILTYCVIFRIVGKGFYEGVDKKSFMECAMDGPFGGSCGGVGSS